MCLLVAATQQIPADGPQAVEPTRAIVIAQPAAVIAGEQHETPLPRGTIVLITHQQGSWRFVPAAKGWVHQQDLVPLENAVQHFTDAIKNDPSPVHYHLRGIARISHRDWRAALSDLQQAYRLGESAVSLHFNLATCFLELGESQRARAELTAILETYPDELPARLARGNLLIEEGNFEAALRDFQEAVKLQPDSAETQHLQGVALRLLGRFEEAIAAYDRALQITPEFADALANRAYAHKSLGSYPAALSDYEAALNIAPNSLPIRNDLAWLLATAPDGEVRDPQRAIEIAESICKQTKHENAEYLDTLAAAYASAERFEAAIEAQQLALTMLPQGASRETMERRLASYRAQQPFLEAPVGTPAQELPLPNSTETPEK